MFTAPLLAVMDGDVAAKAGAADSGPAAVSAAVAAATVATDRQRRNLVLMTSQAHGRPDHAPYAAAHMNAHIMTAASPDWLASVGLEFGGEPVAVRVIDLAEYTQRLRPRPAGGGGVAEAFAGVAEVIEGGGLVPAVGDFPAAIQGSLVAGNSLLIIAELVIDVADAVPDGVLPVGCPQFPYHGQGLLAAGQGQIGRAHV